MASNRRKGDDIMQENRGGGSDVFRAWTSGASLPEVVDVLRPKMLVHLRDDILPFWMTRAVQGEPVGYFPTYISQDGKPNMTKPFYTRMHGRQTYSYLASYLLVQDERLLALGKAGLARLSKLRNPKGGYYSTSLPNGVPQDTPISIQDQCYSVFPYIMAYRILGEREYLDIMWNFVDFINDGPYRRDGRYVDSLFPDMTSIAPFQTGKFNIVSVIDFLNLILIPLLQASPEAEVTEYRMMLLVKWCDMLIDGFFAGGIFWNDVENRSDWSARHVDLGHTSKAYGVLLKASQLLKRLGFETSRYDLIAKMYPPIARAASDADVGWLTDFDGCPTRFRRTPLQWWRHILIDQTVLLFSHVDEDLAGLLVNGVEAWLRLPYADRIRPVRGIREALRPDGTPLDDSDALESKANCWKNGYHEVEHVLSFFEEGGAYAQK